MSGGTSGWTPNSDSLRQLSEILEHSSSANKSARENAKQALEDAKHQPDMDLYLACLVGSNIEGLKQDVQASAGILLKNSIKTRYGRLSPDHKQYIKDNLLAGISSKSGLVRRVSGNVISSIVSSSPGGLNDWPELVPRLIEVIEHGNADHQTGAINTLSNICEDSSSNMQERWIDMLFPKLLTFCGIANPHVQSHSVSCMSQLLLTRPECVSGFSDQFLSTLFSLAGDPTPEIRKNICMAFVLFLEQQPEILIPHLEGVVNFCLHCMKDDDDDTNVEGAEFILALAGSFDGNLEPFLGTIIPVILTCMVYSDVDRMVLESQAEDDSRIEDKAEDIKPHLAKSKEHTSKKTGANDSNNLNSDGEEEDDEDDDDDEDDMGLGDWNLRKCSAAALDEFATKFPAQVFTLCMPHLTRAIEADDWAVREAAILALGAIAEGCMETMSSQGHVASIIPFLIQRTSDHTAPVRQISCWTLSRYSQWICDQALQSGSTDLYAHGLQALVGRCKDPNKRVQESASSAVAVYSESSGESLLAPYGEAVLSQLASCIAVYKARNLIVLYDAIQTVSETLGSQGLASSDSIRNAVTSVWSGLLTKWSQMEKMDKEAWPLMECLGALSAVCGTQLSPENSQAMYTKALMIICECLEMDNAHAQNPSIDPCEPDFIVTSLDLIDGMVQGLGETAAALILHQTQPSSLYDVLPFCFNNPIVEVRQSAFAVLGDMAMYMYSEIVGPHAQQFLTLCATHMRNQSPECHAVLNNSTWALGEIAWRCTRQDIEAHAEEALTTLTNILDTARTNGQSSVVDNAAIALGRLGQCIPDIAAAKLPMFIDNWCNVIVTIEETEEKDSAFQGMCRIVAANPSGLSSESSLLHFIHTLALYIDPSPSLSAVISEILQAFKGYVADWDSMIISKLDPNIARGLSQRYRV